MSKKYADMTESEREAYKTAKREDMLLIGSAHDPSAALSAVYVCELCARASRLVTKSVAELAGHLDSVHGVDGEAIRAATGRMLTHTDATEWYQDDQAFTLQDGRQFALLSKRMRRRGVDRALWKGMGPS